MEWLVCVWSLLLCGNSAKSMLKQCFSDLPVHSDHQRLLFKDADLDSGERSGPEILLSGKFPGGADATGSRNSKALKDFMIRSLHFPGFLQCQPYCVSTAYADSCPLCVWNLLPHLSSLYFTHPCCWPFWHFGLFPLCWTLLSRAAPLLTPTTPL